MLFHAVDTIDSVRPTNNYPPINHIDFPLSLC